jgi:ribose transport system ATP-binding protein
MSENVILEIQNLNKSFVGEFSLTNINLKLNCGDIHFIMGENGAGKSLLMKIIAGYFSADSGDILFKNNIINPPGANKALHGEIYYQHQDLPVFENLSVAENVYFEYRIRNKKKFKLWNEMENISQCRQLFKDLKIPLLPEKSMAYYDFAERQLLFAAKAFLSDAKFLHKLAPK